MKKEILKVTVESKRESEWQAPAAKGSLVQAGVLSHATLRRNLGVCLPSEPYQYPRLPPSR